MEVALQKNISQFIQKGYGKRRLVDRIMRSIFVLCAILAILPLISIFIYILMQGIPAINFSFFTELPKPVGEVGGGMGNAILGSGILILIASFIGLPWGITIGTYLSEYGNSKVDSAIRFCGDLLASIPSIVIGLFVYAIVVLPFRQFSAIAGGIALGIIMIPTVSKTTEELLKLVPMNIREAGLALGIPRWKVIIFIVLKGSRRGISTGAILAVARIAGETAPLLFTAFNNRFWSLRVDQPISSLPVQIYTYAISPFEEWHEQAWSGAFLLVFIVFCVNAAIKFSMRSEPRG